MEKAADCIYSSPLFYDNGMKPYWQQFLLVPSWKELHLVSWQLWGALSQHPTLISGREQYSFSWQ